MDNFEAIVNLITGKKTEYILVEGGLVATTIIVRDKARESIIQLWKNDQKYQAVKKRYVYSLLSGTEIPLPTVLKQGKQGEYEFLMTSLLSGTRLDFAESRISTQDRAEIMKQIGSILSAIHAVPIKQSWGWLDGNTVSTPFLHLEEYIISESNRFQKSLSCIAETGRWQKFDSLLSESIRIIRKYDHSRHLVWYDIQPTNILIRKDIGTYTVSGWLDPGAARIGIPEWDIAHAIIHLCKDITDQENLIKGYTSTELREDLIKAFIPIVLIDDLSLGYDRGWNKVIIEATARLKKLYPYLYD